MPPGRGAAVARLREPHHGHRILVRRRFRVGWRSDRRAGAELHRDWVVRGTGRPGRHRARPPLSRAHQRRRAQHGGSHPRELVRRSRRAVPGGRPGPAGRPRGRRRSARRRARAAAAGRRRRRRLDAPPPRRNDAYPRAASRAPLRRPHQRHRAARLLGAPVPGRRGRLLPSVRAGSPRRPLRRTSRPPRRPRGDPLALAPRSLRLPRRRLVARRRRPAPRPARSPGMERLRPPEPRLDLAFARGDARRRCGGARPARRTARLRRRARLGGAFVPRGRVRQTSATAHRHGK